MSHPDSSSEQKSNESTRLSIQELIQKRLGRRQLISGGVGLATTGALASLLTNCGDQSKTNRHGDARNGHGDEQNGQPDRHGDLRKGHGDGRSLLGFSSVAAILDQSFDSVRVPKGYTAKPFFSWGDPVISGAPTWLADGSNSAEDQELQAGQSHDGMVFFPFAGDVHRGLLAINHEDVEPETLHPKGPTKDAAGARPLPEVKKELAALGVSIIEIRKNQAGIWERVLDSLYNRRITGETLMRLTGPAAGHPLLQTQADPEGLNVRGTLNNCASGYTPWGTYLTCEENFYVYFANKDAADLDARREQSRMGVTTSSRFTWESALERFNASMQKDLDRGGYVNEPNRFGWVVEIDPFQANVIPKKRTALGRFSHENTSFALDEAGRMAFYMGDDARGEYIYKFVPKALFNAKNKAANADILDEGTLFVALFEEDGSGRWIELSYGKNGLNALNNFRSQAEVLINTRSAADHVGATTMDRPEWVAVDPQTRDIYVTLTNNSKRGTADGRNEVNAANPRPNNIFGHIIKLVDADANPHAKAFTWEFFVQAGDPSSSDPNQQGNIRGDIFGSPDGLWFDPAGRLWIETDFDDAVPEYQKNIGLNQMLAADPKTREIRRFLVGPKGCELTGMTGTADQTAMWVNIQHPTLSYPASDGKTRPRSTTVLITKDDGGEIGS